MDDAVLRFQTSRAKSAPIALLGTMMTVLFGGFTSIFVSGAVTEGFEPIDFMGLIPAIFFLFSLLIACAGIRRTLRPDLLILSASGFSMKQAGKVGNFLWTDFQPARRKFQGRWLEIVLEPKAQGRPIRIMGEDYLYPFDVVLNAVQKAQYGQLVDLPQKKAPAAFVYFIVPAVSVATVLFFCAFGICVWGNT